MRFALLLGDYSDAENLKGTPRKTLILKQTPSERPLVEAVGLSEEEADALWIETENEIAEISDQEHERKAERVARKAQEFLRAPEREDVAGHGEHATC